MGKGLKGILAALLCCIGCAPSSPPFKPDRWAVYYNNKLPAEAFQDYDLVVFDRIYHPDIKPLTKSGRTIVLAYVSAGESQGSEKELATLKKHKALMEPRDHWGSHVVDLTSAEWRGMVAGKIQDALDQGFDGVMLDTLDSPLHISALRSPELGEANRQAAIQLISDIRQSHPGIKLMLNRGLAIVPEVSAQLDFILAESILSETNVSTGQSTLFSPNTYRQVATVLQDAQQEATQLKIYTLDYWDQDDVEGIQRLYALQRGNGFSPYVTTPDLQRLSPEPHRTNTKHAAAAPVAIGREDNDA